MSSLPTRRPDPVSALEEQARRFQAQLLSLERLDAANIMGAYQTAARRMASAIRAAQDAVKSMPTGMDAVTWAREERRVRVLQALAQQQMNDFALYAANVITQRQRQLIGEAQRNAQAMTDASLSSEARARLAAANGQTTATAGGFETAGQPSVLPTFKSIPVEAVSHLVGSLGDGTPLRAWADQFGKDAARRIGERLIDGVARGRGAEAIAHSLQDSLAGDAARALTVARTESLRAYRGAKTQWMTANDTIVKGWQWYSRCDADTCPACWGMHGSFHQPAEVMGTHPNCRCLQVAVTKSVDEILGKANAKPDPLPVPDGGELFAKQSPAFQRQVLGPARYEAYAKGKAGLQDMVAARHDRAWGTTRTAATAKRAEQQAAARGHKPPKQTPAPTTKPKRTKRSAGISVEHRVTDSPSQISFDRAVEIVKSVHNPKATLRFGGHKLSKRDRLGEFSPYDTAGNVDPIGEVRIGLDGGKRVGIHEIGHQLDWQMFEASGAHYGTEFVASRESALHEWHNAVKQANGHERIRAFVKTLRNTKRNREYGAYLRTPIEEWARSYEQWITLRSGDAELRALLDVSPHKYWPEEEFAPIAAAMDKLFGVKP